MKPVISFSVFLTIFFFILPLFFSIQASTIIFSDDFNDNLLNDWSEKRNIQWENPSLKCKNFSQDASWIVENGQIGIRIDGPGCVTEITPDNFDLNNVENFSYKLDVRMPLSVSVDRNYVIKYIDGNNWIGVHLIDNRVYFQKYINGIPHFSSSYEATYNFQANQTYEFENIILEDNTIRVLINGTEVLNFIDEGPFIEGGTVGLQASVGAVSESQVFFDNIVVTDLDTTNLDVPFFSQNDPEWAQDEYDSASEYDWGITNPTMDRWGCAVTSASMLLHYFGHNTLPDGTELTPKTLNNWLKDESDGYLSGGINWVAITRLTQKNSELDPELQKLEYTKKNKDDDFLTTQLENDRPIILRVPEVNDYHFVLARGFNDEMFIINDPEATESGTFLTEYGNTYQSMRVFQPSNTDLSYFMFVPSSPDLQFILKNEDGDIIPLEIIMDDAIADHSNPLNKQPDLQIFGIPKPDTGNYTLEITSPTPGNHQVKTLIYNKFADVEIFETTGFVGDEPKILNIEFDKEENGQVEEEVGFEQFIQDLDLMWQLGHFKKYAIYRAIRLETVIADRADKKITKFALAKAIQKSIEVMRPATLSAEGKEYLLQRIDLLINDLKNN